MRKRHQVSVMQFVPSMLKMVLDEITEEDKRALDRLRVVISSGEALHGDLVKRFLQRMPGKLFNTWGATEVSIDSTMHACSEADVQDAVVSVGRPIDNNQVYVLDRNLQPVPTGVAGDLYIGGLRWRGYLNQPERTVQAFYLIRSVRGCGCIEPVIVAISERTAESCSSVGKTIR